MVERPVYEAVYRQLDPRTGERLGRAPAGHAKFAALLAELKAAEPHATAERLLELERQAAQATRKTPAYTDMTVSLSKSISVFHASLRENERQARLSGDLEAAAYWAAREANYQEIVQAANRAGLEHVQRWAGVTRTGHHAARVDGQEPGRYEAAGLVVSSWLQGTSRDGDPQDHVHNQIARMTLTSADGKWRAHDTMALRAQLSAVQAIVATHFECAMAREFGVKWTARADGLGNEISGITQDQMDAYSSRTQRIKEGTPEAVAAWTVKYGRTPNRSELQHIVQEVTMTTRAGKDDGAIDWDALAAKWDATIGGELREIAPRVSGLGGTGAENGAPRDPRDGGPRDPEARNGDRATDPAHWDPAQLDTVRVIKTALATVQEKSATWTRADLLRELATAMPVESRAMDPGEAVELVHALADEALSGAVEQVMNMEAPAWPAVPDSLRRDVDGRSMYTRPGTTRYATGVQLSLEDRLIQAAGRETAPCLMREELAAALGSDDATLTARLSARAQESRDALSSGLRLDQAAALHHALTSPRTAEVIVGPAGSGKTRTLAEAARLWGGSKVVGVTPSQASRNVLAGAGVATVYNFAQFLGHLPGAREALGRMELDAGSLILIDEGSMLSTSDMAAIVAYAADRGSKVIISGDQEQLAAVEGGGGMLLLAHQLGHTQLAEPVRFTAQWERDASLRLRAGDAAVLADYDEQGRIRGGTLDEALDQARKAYVAGTLAGRDPLLMAASWEHCRELSSRIREDLIHLGIVQDGEETELAGGARASVGDLIIAGKNDHAVGIANGDTLRVEGIIRDPINGDRLSVRRVEGTDRQTGERQYSEPFVYCGCRENADLAYAVTGHSAQGRTVTTGLAVVAGGEDRQWLYVAMSRGTDGNYAYVSTAPKAADPDATTRPAPEIERHERDERERAALPQPPSPVAHVIKHVEDKEPEPERPAVAVLADVIGKDGAEVSAKAMQATNLANADHLGVLHATWQGETGEAIRARYERTLREVVPGLPDVLSHRATWLWRTLRAADVAGHDPRDVIQRAVAERGLKGSRDVVAVIDARIREATGFLVPLGAPAWKDQAEAITPEITDPGKAEYVGKIAAALDARKERIGEHVAATAPVWAMRALGSVPDEPLDRLEWEARAADIGAYRELYGYADPVEAIGPEPINSPEARAHWHTAFGRLGPVDGVDVRGVADGSLWHMRDTYERATSWAPPHVGEALRQVRVSAEDSELTAIRAEAEVSSAADAEIAGRHSVLSGSARAAERIYRDHEARLSEAMEARRAWELATEHERHLAIAADSEIRRRHPDATLPPLKSAEPGRPTADDRAALVPEGDGYEAPAWIAELAERVRNTHAKLDERKSVMIPAEDPDYEYEGEAWPDVVAIERDAILQPPKPEIRPAPEVAVLAAERMRETTPADREAAE